MAVVKLTQTRPEHIITNDQPICDGSIREETSMRILESDSGPLAEASIHLCDECRFEWGDRDSPDRDPTVRCACDRVEPDAVYTCGRVVTTQDARVLRNPDAGVRYVPVCQDCYEWICSRPHNSVSKSYEDALSWGNPKHR